MSSAAMDSPEEPITIDRGYFETLVRRAQFNSDTPARPEASVVNVNVSQKEYDTLRQIARQYANLRENLMRGGVDEDVIALLSRDDANQQTHGEQTGETLASTVAPSDKLDGGVRLNIGSQVSTARHGTSRRPTNVKGYGNGSSGLHNHGVSRRESQDWAEADGIPDDESCSGEVDGPPGAYDDRTQNEQPRQREQFERQCSRTVQLVNLPDGVLHRDITAAVRGGLLLEVFLRTHERTATVSFLRAAEAQYFFDHAKKHDIYVKNKRVDVRWPERKFTLSGHVASKIGIGASRNLIIRRCDSRLTEKMIRDDLEHIHNLVVIKVQFSNSSCYISTNSIHNAMFARTCLMSRGVYKGSKIEWDVDECAQPYPAPRQPRKESNPAVKKVDKKFTNMYDLLADPLGGDQDDDDEHEISPGFHRENPVGIAA